MAGRKAKAYEPRNTLNTRKGDYGIVEMGRVKRVFEKIYFASGMLPGIFSEDALFDKYMNNRDFSQFLHARARARKKSMFTSRGNCGIMVLIERRSGRPKGSLEGPPKSRRGCCDSKRIDNEKRKAERYRHEEKLEKGYEFSKARES